jgi:hypothetical protein
LQVEQVVVEEYLAVVMVVMVEQVVVEMVNKDQIIQAVQELQLLEQPTLAVEVEDLQETELWVELVEVV